MVRPDAATVLVVDDETVLRRLTARLLERAGYQVLEAGTADEALRLTSEATADVVLCDVRLPGMDGVELSRRLRERGVHLPTILMSGDDAEDPSRGIPEELPFLAKPFTFEALASIVGDAVRPGGVAPASP